MASRQAEDFFDALNEALIDAPERSLTALADALAAWRAAQPRAAQRLSRHPFVRGTLGAIDEALASNRRRQAEEAAPFGG